MLLRTPAAPFEKTCRLLSAQSAKGILLNETGEQQAPRSFLRVKQPKTCSPVRSAANRHGRTKQTHAQQYKPTHHRNQRHPDTLSLCTSPAKQQTCISLLSGHTLPLWGGQRTCWCQCMHSNSTTQQNAAQKPNSLKANCNTGIGCPSKQQLHTGPWREQPCLANGRQLPAAKP